MEKLQFKTVIDAPVEKVWDILWGSRTYPAWTSVFAEGSNVETDWKTGSKAIFLDGKNDGMVSRIAENRPKEFMSFNHLGIIKNGVEDLQSEEAKKWAGASENYTLRNVNGKTELTVSMDVTNEFKEYMEKTFPLALNKIKAMAEAVMAGFDD